MHKTLYNISGGQVPACAHSWSVRVQ